MIEAILQVWFWFILISFQIVLVRDILKDIDGDNAKNSIKPRRKKNEN
jgi:hypothetical protein